MTGTVEWPKRKRGEPPLVCAIEGCARVVLSRGWCSAHYAKWKKYGDPLVDATIRRGPCTANGCDRLALAKNFCQLHYRRWVKHGDPHYEWTPERQSDWYRTRTDYVVRYWPEHPNAAKNGTTAQHVATMTEHLGRSLRKGESVHHKNGIRHDNRIENLELWISAHPPGQRVTDLIAWAHELLERYKDDLPLWPEGIQP